MATALVTGANRGIGLELVRQLAARGDRVIAVCRRGSDELSALAGVEVIDGVDVSSDEAVAGLARVVGAPIDLLVLNAGVYEEVELDALDFDAMRWQIEVNAFGPLRVVAALRDRLGAGSKIGILTSRMGSISDNTSGGHYGYRMSKAAVNMAGKNLARDLAPSRISVCLLHPGFVRTGMTGGQGLIDAPQSAAGLLARMDELRLSTTGSFWHQDGTVLPW